MIKLDPLVENVSIFGVRHLQCLLLFLGLSVGYAMRVNLFIAIVAMTDKNETTNADLERYSYKWTEQTKSFILSSFFWGYIITQVPAGQLAFKYGGKKLLRNGLLLSSILAFFTPIFVHIGDWRLLCVIRVLQGLSQGVIFPCTHAILSNWAPVEEQGALCAFCYAGTLFGVVIMFFTSGILASSHLAWPSIFHISGLMGFAWILVWTIWGADEPSKHPSITAKERQLIESSLYYESVEKQKQLTTFTKTPWLKILTSPAVLVLIITHCANNWGFWTMLTQLPTYIKVTFHKDIKSNAQLSALPYLAMLLLSFVFSLISIFLTKSERVTLSLNRKLLNTIGQWIPSVTLLLLAYTAADHINMAIFLLTLTVGLNAAAFSGFQVNHIDLSSNFAGVLMGITNCCAHIMSIIAPLIVGIVVTDETNPDQWRTIFFIAAGFYFVGNLLFIIFGRTDEQPWNDLKKENVRSVEMLKLTSIS